MYLKLHMKALRVRARNEELGPTSDVRHDHGLSLTIIILKVLLDLDGSDFPSIAPFGNSTFPYSQTPLLPMVSSWPFFLLFSNSPTAIKCQMPCMNCEIIPYFIPYLYFYASSFFGEEGRGSL